MSKPTPPGSSAPEAWQATRAQTALATQFLRDEDDYLDTERKDIGRQIGANERELFVSCEPALAMQQQFDHLRPDYIAVHDVGGHASRKLLSSIAAASQQPLQKLIIRRQGYGTPLATIDYAELPTAGGVPLRIYATEIDADAAARQGIARVLLAYSRLGVVMVGDLPAHALGAALKPLHDDMVAGPWHNRHLLLLPLTSASALVSAGMELARGTGVNVRTTPQVTRPADAWSYINATWSRLREGNRIDSVGTPPDSQWASGRTMPAPLRDLPPLPARNTRAAPLTPESAFAETQIQDTPPAPPPAAVRPVPPREPLAMRPMPTVQPAAAATPASPDNLLDRYVRQLSELTGMVSCCVFDLATGREITHAGASPGATELSAHGSELMAAMISSARSLGLGFAMPDAAITLGAHHLLLRPVPRHPGMALHAVLDKTNANLTLARLQVQRMDALFEPAEATR